MYAASIFDPTKFPTEEALISAYGFEEIRILADFYGKDATVEYEGTIHTSSPLLDQEELFLLQWKTFRRALIQEKKVYHTKRISQPSLQEKSRGSPPLYQTLVNTNSTNK